MSIYFLLTFTRTEGNLLKIYKIYVRLKRERYKELYVKFFFKNRYKLA